MANRRSEEKVNIPMLLACVLLCLTVISVYLTSGLYARYATSATAADSARVIAFRDLSITETGDFTADGKLMIIPGVDIEKKAVVNFGGSEASTYVFLEVTVTSGNSSWSVSSDGMAYSVHNSSMKWSMNTEWKFLKQDSNCCVYYRELAPNTALTAEVIKDNTVYVSEFITKADISRMTGISIHFQATAVQSNGFSGPEAAWASLVSK